MPRKWRDSLHSASPPISTINYHDKQPHQNGGALRSVLSPGVAVAMVTHRNVINNTILLEADPNRGIIGPIALFTQDYNQIMASFQQYPP